MNLNLPSDVNKFVNALVASGRFDSEEAAVVEGVRLLMNREKLREDVGRGVRQLDNGECFEEDEVFQSVENVIRSVEASKQNP